MKLSSAVIEETLTLIVQCFSRTYGFFFFSGFWSWKTKFLKHTKSFKCIAFSLIIKYDHQECQAHIWERRIAVITNVESKAWMEVVVVWCVCVFEIHICLLLFFILLSQTQNQDVLCVPLGLLLLDQFVPQELNLLEQRWNTVELRLSLNNVIRRAKYHLTFF